MRLGSIGGMVIAIAVLALCRPCAVSTTQVCEAFFQLYDALPVVHIAMSSPLSSLSSSSRHCRHPALRSPGAWGWWRNRRSEARRRRLGLRR